jgi:histidyl-tRNA synthetase
LERGIGENEADLFTSMFEGFQGLEQANESPDAKSFQAFNKAFLDRWEEGLNENDAENLQVLGDMRQLLTFCEKNNSGNHVKIDPTLARGLSYYTGTIIEIVLTKGDFSGSITGGGRYDGLIGMFGKEQIPACGLSIGLERIIVVMDERGMFPPELETNAADVLVTIWNEESAGESLKLANELRQSSLRVLVYPEADKLGKQFKYASQVGVSFVCVLGETELAENNVTLKNMQTGAQETVARAEIAERIKKDISVRD